MEFTLVNRAQGPFDAVIRFLPAGEPVSFKDQGLLKAYQTIFGTDSLTLEHKQIKTIRLPFNGGFSTVLLAGFDNRAAAPFDALRQITAKLGTLLSGCGETVFLDGVDALTFAPGHEVLGQIAAVLPLCEYTFDKYFTVKKPRICHKVSVPGPQSDDSDAQADVKKAMEDALKEGLVLARAVMTARDFVNESADDMCPEAMADRCVALGKTYGFSVDVLDREACAARNMNLFLAVAKGSVLEPKFIVMHWNGGAEGEKPIAIVGKGITYDSGGLAIKTKGMESMRFDMNGAAAAIGTMCAVAAEKLPRNVVAVVAACENMVDAKSYRNGDVITSMNGKTVFVRNTDAEGRLTMADAMTYCVRYEHPSEMFAVAGLTGSVCNFYGSVCAAALTTSQFLFDRVNQLTPVTGEKYAQMPSFPEYAELLKTPYADLNNAPEGGPGGILAGMFLNEFSEDVPFLHVDFGAMPFTSKKSDGQPEGGTGFGVKTLYYYVKNH